MMCDNVKTSHDTRHQQPEEEKDDDSGALFKYPLQSMSFHNILSKCYKNASSSLLHLLFNDYDFMGVLTAFKKYFY